MININETVTRVGIADLKLVTAPETIRTSGLGSCVGVVIYDATKKIAGLSHVLLPDSSHTKQTNFNKYKYANTAIPELIDQLIKSGARRHALQAKIAGGAQMFKFTSSTDILRIGSRNIEAVQNRLQEYQIPIVSSDVGGNAGRTIDFDPNTCKLKIRKVNKEEYFI